MNGFFLRIPLLFINLFFMADEMDTVKSEGIAIDLSDVDGMSDTETKAAISKVSAVLFAEQRTAENAPDLMVRARERLTGMELVAMSGVQRTSFNAWSGIVFIINDSLWNDTNFLNSMVDIHVLIAAVSDPVKLELWLRDTEFIKSLRVVLSHLYKKFADLKEKKAYGGQFADMGLQDAFCKRGLFSISKVIPVIEFILRAAAGGPREYVESEAVTSQLPVAAEHTAKGADTSITAESAFVRELARFKTEAALLDSGERRYVEDSPLASGGSRVSVQKLSSYGDLPKVFDPKIEAAFRAYVEQIVVDLKAGVRMFVLPPELYSYLEEVAHWKGTKLANLLAVLSGKALNRNDNVFTVLTMEEVDEILSSRVS